MRAKYINIYKLYNFMNTHVCMCVCVCVHICVYITLCTYVSNYNMYLTVFVFVIRIIIIGNGFKIT